MVVEGIIDTSIFIDYLRRFTSAQNWLEGAATQRFAITPIVWMKTVQGANNKIEFDRALQILNQFAIEHPKPEDNQWAMRQLARFQLSHKIGFQDVMIASVAIGLNIPIFTNNVRHYSLLPGVTVQRPY
jgi:predicted nucleic acid-binding protein